jgi:hypothetical protein
MKIAQKRIRNLEKYLSPIALGNKVVFGVNAVSQFASVLQKAGFTEALEVGESVLPAPIFGARSRFNSHGSKLVHRDQPKEEVCRLIEWTWKQWAGGGQVEEQSDWRDRCYPRYPRTPIPAPSIELTIVTNAQGEKLVVAPAMIYTPEKRSQLLHVINLLLEIFGECDILQENLDAVIPMPQTLKRLNWRVLPPGRIPWSQVESTVGTIVERAPRGNRRLIADRLQTIHQYEPNFLAVGEAGFTGYFVFGFPAKKLFVLESIYSDNATYVLDEDWEQISRLTKAEILDQSLHQERIVHRVGWHTLVKKLLA